MSAASKHKIRQRFNEPIDNQSVRSLAKSTKSLTSQNLLEANANKAFSVANSNKDSR